MSRYCFLMLFLMAAVAAPAADVTGNWEATVETDAGSGSPKFTFKQTGETLTGTYSGQLGEAPLTGTVKGSDIEFSFKASPQGETVTVKYKGKITGEKQMKGTVDLGGMATGTFTATKTS
jgi:hypothetical protein